MLNKIQFNSMWIVLERRIHVRLGVCNIKREKIEIGYSICQYNSINRNTVGLLLNQKKIAEVVTRYLH